MGPEVRRHVWISESTPITESGNIVLAPTERIARKEGVIWRSYGDSRCRWGGDAEDRPGDRGLDTRARVGVRAIS